MKLKWHSLGHGVWMADGYLIVKRSSGAYYCYHWTEDGGGWIEMEYDLVAAKMVCQETRDLKSRQN